MEAKKILVVDDEPAIVKTIEMRLTANGYRVVTGKDGEDALQKIANEKPDLVVMDVMMPPPNGYRACRQIKDQADTKTLPIILLTAKSSDSDKFWGQESGADAYITKPYNSDELLEKIRELLS